MELCLTFGFVNLVYGLIWWLIHRFRTSDDHDWRIMNNDYEYYESLAPEAKEPYWQGMNQVIQHLMFRIAIVMNLSLVLPFTSLPNVVVLYFMVMVIGFLIVVYRGIKESKALAQPLKQAK